MNGAKIATVARREFLTTVRRKSYLIFTFGMPVFAALYLGLVGVLPVLLMERQKAETKVVGVVDRTPERLIRFTGPEPEDPAALAAARRVLETLGEAGPGAGQVLQLAVAGNVSFVLFDSEEEALAALREERIGRYYVVPADWVATGAMKLVMGKESVLTGASGVGDRFRGHLRESVLLWGGVADHLRRRVQTPIQRDRVEVLSLQDDGSLGPRRDRERIAEVAVPVALGLLLLVALMFTSGYLLHGVAEEKENRVIEIILSSVRPDELLMGKVLGLGAAGLIQLVVWSSAGIAAGLASAVLTRPDLPLLVLCLVFFLLGYLTLGTLMAGSGSLGSTVKESQQLASLWSVLSVLPPAVTWMVITDQPQGLLARALSYLPFTAPVTMMIRLGAAGPPWKAGGVPAWDLSLSLGMLLAGTWFGAKLGGKLFRLGVLMTGKRPSLKTVARMLRAA